MVGDKLSPALQSRFKMDEDEFYEMIYELVRESRMRDMMINDLITMIVEAAKELDDDYTEFHDAY